MDILKTINLSPGLYVVAVSGGVDSMVLLDLLLKYKKLNPKIKLVVAHFDHGIRQDSGLDRQVVAEIAKQHNLPFVYASGNLGPNTSEAQARQARYDFLHKVREKSQAHGIITAHHLDDELETATHNILRGTGRKGVSSLRSRSDILRPLLHLPKDRLIKHAHENQLMWREDSTNTNLRYRRNFIRQVVLPNLKTNHPEKYHQLKRLVKRQHDLNRIIDEKLNLLLHLQPQVRQLSRQSITMLPHKVAREIVAQWLRNNGARDFNRPLIERLTVLVKAAKPSTTFVINKYYQVDFDIKHARLKVPEQ